MLLQLRLDLDMIKNFQSISKHVELLVFTRHLQVLCKQINIYDSLKTTRTIPVCYFEISFDTLDQIHVQFAHKKLGTMKYAVYREFGPSIPECVSIRMFKFTSRLLMGKILHSQSQNLFLRLYIQQFIRILLQLMQMIAFLLCHYVGHFMIMQYWFWTMWT